VSATADGPAWSPRGCHFRRRRLFRPADSCAVHPPTRPEVVKSCQRAAPVVGESSGTALGSVGGGSWPWVYGLVLSFILSGLSSLVCKVVLYEVMHYIVLYEVMHYISLTTHLFEFAPARARLTPRSPPARSRPASRGRRSRGSPSAPRLLRRGGARRLVRRLPPHQPLFGRLRAPRRVRLVRGEGRGVSD